MPSSSTTLRIIMADFSLGRVLIAYKSWFAEPWSLVFNFESNVKFESRMKTLFFLSDRLDIEV